MFSKNRSHLLAVCNSVAEQFCPRLRPAAALSRADRRKYQLQRRRCYSSAAGKGILLQSDYGTVAVPQLNVSQFIWKDYEKWGDKPMVTCGISGKSYTFEQGRYAATRFASALINQIGLKKGDVVGLLLPNMPEYVIAIHGAIEAGIITTFVNPMYTPEEVYRQFADADVRCCVTIPELLPLLEKISPRIKNYTQTVVVNPRKVDVSKSSAIDFDQLISSHSPSNLADSNIKPSDIAVLPYSSGTTGLPKGVMLTHANLIVNLEQLHHPSMCTFVGTTDASQEITLSVLPFFHIYGFNAILNNNMRQGMHLVTLPKFTPENYLQCLIKFKPTQLYVVPSLMLFMTSHPSVKPEYLATVKEIVSGAAPSTKSLIANFKNKFYLSKITIRQGYGMTESSPCVLLTPLDAKSSKDGSVGKLLKGTEARVVSLNTGADQPAHESGELLVRGPQVMKGYWKNDAATKETIDAEGWLHTGDVAYYDDDGYFFIIDRTKELIKVKGNQCYGWEVDKKLKMFRLNEQETLIPLKRLS
ncbi:hypothetical protein V9T40_006273 [Parthenolecanium corni]|uniref:AMP-dependent synthetase/ligase domain-containing protein n=1 Tax=Parthenolecanium corni TaxID=536013 RepID=A0AAN9Y791_9HEMI